MADRLVLVARGEDGRSDEIIWSFAQHTGLEPALGDGEALFELGPGDHRIDVVQTLTEIDPGWAEHVALGDPGADPGSD